MHSRAESPATNIYLISYSAKGSSPLRPGILPTLIRSQEMRPFTQRPVHLFLILVILLVSSSTIFKSSVEGRSLFWLSPTSGRGEEEKVRALIGSRPPICERRCKACGHCEAVQVPVIPQDAKRRSKQFQGVATLGSDYSSNYKPLSWKCKCGDMIFNP